MILGKNSFVSSSKITMTALSLSLVLNYYLTGFCLNAYSLQWLNARSYCHNRENIGSPPWLDYRRKFCILLLLKCLCCLEIQNRKPLSTKHILEWCAHKAMTGGVNLNNVVRHRRVRYPEVFQYFDYLLLMTLGKTCYKKWQQLLGK